MFVCCRWPSGARPIRFKLSQFSKIVEKWAWPTSWPRFTSWVKVKIDLPWKNWTLWGNFLQTCRFVEWEKRRRMHPQPVTIGREKEIIRMVLLCGNWMAMQQQKLGGSDSFDWSYFWCDAGNCAASQRARECPSARSWYKTLNENETIRWKIDSLLCAKEPRSHRKQKMLHRMAINTPNNPITERVNRPLENIVPNVS